MHWRKNLKVGCLGIIFKTGAILFVFLSLVQDTPKLLKGGNWYFFVGQRVLELHVDLKVAFVFPSETPIFRSLTVCEVKLRALAK